MGNERAGRGLHSSRPPAAYRQLRGPAYRTAGHDDNAYATRDGSAAVPAPHVLRTTHPSLHSKHLTQHPCHLRRMNSARAPPVSMPYAVRRTIRSRAASHRLSLKYDVPDAGCCSRSCLSAIAAAAAATLLLLPLGVRLPRCSESVYRAGKEHRAVRDAAGKPRPSDSGGPAALPAAAAANGREEPLRSGALHKLYYPRPAAVDSAGCLLGVLTAWVGSAGLTVVGAWRSRKAKVIKGERSRS